VPARLELAAAAPSAVAPPADDYLDGLNPAQRRAVEYGIGDGATSALSTPIEFSAFVGVRP